MIKLSEHNLQEGDGIPKRVVVKSNRYKGHTRPDSNLKIALLPSKLETKSYKLNEEIVANHLRTQNWLV
jgi:hypothetical protein